MRSRHGVVRLPGMPAPLQTAIIRSEPDAFDMTEKELVGRRAAGHGFLRAAVAARGDGPIYGHSPTQASGGVFARLVREIDPQARTEFIPGDHLHRLSDPGVLYLGDAILPPFARLRLRQGPAAYSLCGVSHTTATTSTMDAICDYLSAPVAPWDAFICTSAAVLETVRRLHEAEADYLRWRLGDGVRIEGPQLPVIPLGVHCDDFVFSEAQRAAARDALGLDADEIVALYVGRFVFHGKAHPLPMYRALEEAAARTGRRVALVQCGWAPGKFIQDAFERGAADFAPSVRTIFVDGRIPEGRERAWASADLFVSLVDGIQESFGLTPIEAKAAGLPVIVTDWDGYRDTVREGVDGFRIATWAPGEGAGQPLARAFEAGTLDYGRYCWSAAASTSIDMGELFNRITALVDDAGLRRRMGEAGRQDARANYDWAVVYRQYQALWGELTARRLAAAAEPGMAQRLAAAPRVSPRRLDPFVAFGHYPTSSIGRTTVLRPSPEASAETLRTLHAHPLFHEVLVSADAASSLLSVVQRGAVTIADAAAALSQPETAVSRTAGLLAKMGLVEFAG